MGEGEECGDVLEAVAVTVTQVRRDRWWFWGGRVEMEKGRIREVEWKRKMVENGWFWGKKKEKPLRCSESCLVKKEDGGAICRDKKSTLSVESLTYISGPTGAWMNSTRLATCGLQE